MKHPSTHSIVIIGAPEDFIERSSLQSRNDDFSNLRYLGIDLVSLKKDVPGIKALVSRTSRLSGLSLNDVGKEVIQVCEAIADQQTYPITISRQSCRVRISPPTEGSRQSTGTTHNVKEPLHLYDKRIEALDSDMCGVVRSIMNYVGDSIDVTDIRVMDRDQMGEAYIKYIAVVVSRSDLSSLWIDVRREEERAQILESIQWKHIRHLRIYMDKESAATRAMKALVEGRDKEKGQAELDAFWFSTDKSDSLVTVSGEWTTLFKSFVASTPIRHFVLDVHLTPSDMVSVFNAMDMSRLDFVWLRPAGYSSSEVDRLLGCLRRAHKLKSLSLSSYTATQKQKKTMKERGVSF
jgi:hypothetical protein